MGKKEKALKDMTDKDLSKLAKKLKVEITNDMDRGDVEAAIKEIQGWEKGGKKEPEQVVNSENKKVKKPERLPRGKVLLRNIIQQGSVTIGKVKWSGLTQRVISEEKAEELIAKFPKRFLIIKRG